MKPEDLPKSSYNYEVYYCEKDKDIQKILQKHKDRAGFYPYFLSQSKGIILVIATANLEAIADRHKPKRIKGLRRLTEREAKKAACMHAYANGLVSRLRLHTHLFFVTGILRKSMLIQHHSCNKL